MILQNLSIKRKLTLITMLTSSLALILSSASFLIYDLVSFRHLLSQDPVGLQIQAYCAIIACLLIHLWTGGRPTLRSYEMVCFYLSGWADLDELTTHLEKLAALSGGRMFEAASVQDLKPVYAQVADELRSVYTIGYYPENKKYDGKYRGIKVKVKRPGLTVRSSKEGL